MMLWRDIQHEFAAALCDPSAAPPAAVEATTERPAVRRFNVYRNNVMVSLIEALGAGYPVVKELVGEEFFKGMARAYVASHKPHSPVMLHYGDDFPAFIAAFKPAEALPFLSDVARVELGWNQAYHAADCDAVTIDNLQTVTPEHLETVKFRLHPSLHLLYSQWPAVSIWQIHQTSDNPAEAMQQLSPEPEHMLIVRPRWDVDVRLLPEATWTFFKALHAGSCLGAAAETLVEAEMAEMGQMLQLLFKAGLVIGISPAPQSY